MTDIEAPDLGDPAVPRKAEPFRFFDNREKYLLFVMTTSEKPRSRRISCLTLG